MVCQCILLFPFRPRCSRCSLCSRCSAPAALPESPAAPLSALASTSASLHKPSAHPSCSQQQRIYSPCIQPAGSQTHGWSTLGASSCVGLTS
jgi:hypothetical protein